MDDPGPAGAGGQPAAQIGWRQRAIDWLRATARTVVGPAEEAAQGQDVLRRALLAPAIIAILPIQQLHFSGWPAILGACSAAVLYDIPLAYLVFVRKRIFLARVLAFIFDALLLSVASVFVLRALGQANSSSDIWLAFLVFAVSGGFVLPPIGSIIYTALAMGSFVVGTYRYFPSNSQYHDQLIVRVVFFAIFGLMSMGIAQELERRRTKLVNQNRQLAESKSQLEEKSYLLEHALRTERERARRDPLTDTLNHAAIVDALRRLIIKPADSASLVVAMADVDSLKAINDTFGHQVGDTVLVAVAEALSRDGAIVGRYGGDEFVVILPKAGRETVARYRHEVLDTLASHQLSDPETGARVLAEISLGFAAYPEEAAGIEDLIKLSDSAMYASRRERVRNGSSTLPQRGMSAGRAAAIVGEIVPLLTAPADLDDKLRLVANRLSAAGGFDAVDIDLSAADSPLSGRHALTFAPAVRELAPHNGQTEPGEHLLQALMRRLHRPIILDDVQSDDRLTSAERELLVKQGIRSALTAPMIWQAEYVGTLWVGSKRRAAFGPADAQLLATVSSQVTAIVRMSTLVEQLQATSDSLRQSQVETVTMLAAAAEAHDRTTGVHLQGVRAIAYALAREIGYSEADAQAIGLGSVLHDIGKIRVPDSLLANPGQLTDAERELMNKHTTWGAEFLAGRRGFELASQIARSHHEHWDGSGYPDHLRGEAIPRAAAVVAVADAFDAIIRDRPYRKARSISEAIAEIEAAIGSQFSPLAAQALVRLYRLGVLDRLHGAVAAEAA